MKKLTTYLWMTLVAGGLALGLSSLKPSEAYASCLPTDEEIEAYKADGSWEERQAYFDALEYDNVSPELLQDAIQRENPNFLFSAGENIPESWKGAPVTGDVKVLAIQVEFQDMTFEDSKIYPEDIFYQMFNNTEGSETLPYPYESLHAYYLRSSYGQLSFSSGDVYRCTLSKNRADYDGSFSGEQDLLREVFELLDEEIDYNDYDSDGDGCVDAVYINFAGENTGWASTWWSHKYNFQDTEFELDGQKFGGYVFLETDTDYGYGCQTIIHESGHILGLPDYYASPYSSGHGLQTTDMMNNNNGDHNGFSKWLLGWIPDENIQKVTKTDGEQDISLAPISSESLTDQKLIAVIAPEDTSIYSEYFLVQYDEPIQNNTYAASETGYRVFHVDAQLNYEGTDFMYDNLYCTEPMLISALLQKDKEYINRDFYLPGDVLNSDTNDSTWFYGESISSYTGISLSDFQTGETSSFHVKFEEQEKGDGTVNFTIPDEYLPVKNTAFMKITCDVDLYMPDNTSDMPYIYMEADGTRYPLSIISLKNKRELTLSYLSHEPELKPNTQYSLVIPEKTFLTGEDTYNKEWRTTVQTTNFPNTEILVKTEHDGLSKSNIVSPDQKNTFRTSFVSRDDSTHLTLKIETCSSEGTISSRQITVPCPEDAEMNILKMTACYDGKMILSITTYRNHTLLYQLDEKGDYLAGPLEVSEKLVLIPSGNGVKAIIDGTNTPAGAPPVSSDSNEGPNISLYTIDFENGVVCNTINTIYAQNIFAIDENLYALTGLESVSYENVALIYDSKDQLVYRLAELPEDHAYATIISVGKTENNYYMWYAYQYASSPFAQIRCAVYDMNGTFVNDTEFSSFYTESYQDIDSSWTLQKAEWGYTLFKTLANSDSICLFMDASMEPFSELILTGNNNHGIPLGDRYAYVYNTYGETDQTIYGLTVALKDDPKDPEESEETEESKETKETKETEESKETKDTKETKESKETTTSKETKETSKKSSTSSSNSAKTGDQPIGKWMLLFIISGLAIAVSAIVIRKKN